MPVNFLIQREVLSCLYFIYLQCTDEYFSLIFSDLDFSQSWNSYQPSWLLLLSFSFLFFLSIKVFSLFYSAVFLWCASIWFSLLCLRLSVFIKFRQFWDSSVGSPDGASGKEPTYQWGRLRDSSSVPRWERYPGEGWGNPLWCSCLENPMDRGTWWATVHRVTKSGTWLKWLSMHVQDSSIFFLFTPVLLPRIVILIICLRLLGFVPQVTEALIFYFFLRSLCTSFWIVYVLFSSSLMLSSAAHNLL